MASVWKCCYCGAVVDDGDVIFVAVVVVVIVFVDVIVKYGGVEIPLSLLEISTWKTNGITI